MRLGRDSKDVRAVRRTVDARMSSVLRRAGEGGDSKTRVYFRWWVYCVCAPVGHNAARLNLPSLVARFEPGDSPLVLLRSPDCRASVRGQLQFLCTSPIETLFYQRRAAVENGAHLCYGAPAIDASMTLASAYTLTLRRTYEDTSNSVGNPWGHLNCPNPDPGKKPPGLSFAPVLFLFDCYPL